MRIKNELTVSKDEWGSFALTPEGEAKELKHGAILLNCILLEQMIKNDPNFKDFDLTAPTELIMDYPITVPAVLFGKQVFVKLVPISTEAVEKLIFRKEAWIEDTTGDIVKAKFEKMHTDGLPVYSRNDNEGAGDDPEGVGHNDKKSKSLDIPSNSRNNVR
jgi:hypothetical protein